MAFYIQNSKTNERTRFKNVEFYPAFLFLPKECFIHYPSILAKVPRNPHKILKDRDALKYIASNEFLEVIIDFYAYASWPYMAARHNLERNMEVYSGYDAAWMIAHCPALWIKTLEDEKILSRMSELLSSPVTDTDFGFATWEYFNLAMEYIVPLALERNDFDEVILSHRRIRCHEDFDDRDSYDKIDMYRKWYHARSKHETISLEGFQESYQELNGVEWDLCNSDLDIETLVTEKIFAENFLETLEEQDRKILTLRMQGKTYAEIAGILGYKTHSAVLKRVRRIETLFAGYAGEDYLLDTYLKKKHKRHARQQKSA